MRFLSALKNKDLNGKVCLLRIDVNILNEDLNVKNFRIQAILPTIKFLVKNGAKVVLMSHRGRPQTLNYTEQTRNNAELKKLSLRPFVKIFEKLLKQKIIFSDSVNTITKEDIYNSKNGIYLLENLRFFKGEEKNDLKFAKQLANLGDMFINDAFAVSHRENASITSITKYLSSYCGLLLENEIINLDKAIKGAKHPTTLILGGAKISDKTDLVKNFISASRRKADSILTGGGIAINFFKAQGLPIGDSINDENANLSEIRKLLVKSKNILLPIDVIIDNRKILDIGLNTVKLYTDIIKKSKIIIWNGPMGQVENKKFRKGSEGIVKAIMQSKAFTVVGGGETSALFVKGQRLKIKGNLFISTGGGAMLEYLGGKKLPGIEALEK